MHVGKKQVTVAQCHLSLEIHIRTTVAKHVALIKMIVVNKGKRNSYWHGYGKIQTLGQFGRNVKWCSPILCSMTVAQKTRRKLLYSSVILSLSRYPKKLKTEIPKIICKLSVEASAYSPNKSKD